MKLPWLIFFLTFLFYVCPSWADTNQVMTLKDGSQIKGHLISASGDSYTIRTATMGDVKVDASQIATIANADTYRLKPSMGLGSPGSVTDSQVDQKIQATQTKLTGNPHMMAEIQDMIKDPQLMQLLSDPGLTQAVMSHDVKAIQNNPKVQELMNNPKMRALIDEMRNNRDDQPVLSTSPSK